MVKAEQIEQIRAANPSMPIHVYQGAGHAFSNADRANYHGESSLNAQQRTLTFLEDSIH